MSSSLEDILTFHKKQHKSDCKCFSCSDKTHEKTIAKMSPNEQLEIMKKYLAEGNQLYREGCICDNDRRGKDNKVRTHHTYYREGALKYYERVLNHYEYFDYSFVRSSSTWSNSTSSLFLKNHKARQEQQLFLKRQAFIFHLSSLVNASACLLKMKRYMSCIDYTTIAVDEWNDTQLLQCSSISILPVALNALYLRSQAYRYLDKFDKAKDDILKANKILSSFDEHGNFAWWKGSFVAEGETLNKMVQEYEQQFKKVAKNMFSSSSIRSRSSSGRKKINTSEKNGNLDRMKMSLDEVMKGLFHHIIRIMMVTKMKGDEHDVGDTP